MSIPVKLGTAVSEDKLPLHQVRRKDASRIKLKRVAEADGQEVEWADLTMGYETGSGQTVLVEDADFEAAYGEKSRDAKILMFVDLGGVVPRRAHDTSYVVQPGPGGERAYELLAEAMTRAGKVAVVSIAVRQREALAMLYAADGYLILERLQWAANVKQPDFAAPHTEIGEAEISLAQNLVTSMSGTFDWQARTDTSMEKLSAVIQGKVENGQLTGTPKAPGSNPAPLNLAEALKASVAAAKATQKPARKPRTRKTATEVKAA